MELAVKEDTQLLQVRKWLQDLIRPSELSDAEYSTFMLYCTEFFVDEGQLWRKDSHGAHKLIIWLDERLNIMRQAHDDIGHKGIYLTRALVSERFWWPQLPADIVWFVRTCHLCQVRQTHQALIPPLLQLWLPYLQKSTWTPCTCLLPADTSLSYRRDVH